MDLKVRVGIDISNKEKWLKSKMADQNSLNRGVAGQE